MKHYMHIILKETKENKKCDIKCRKIIFLIYFNKYLLELNRLN